MRFLLIFLVVSLSACSEIPTKPTFPRTEIRNGWLYVLDEEESSKPSYKKPEKKIDSTPHRSSPVKYPIYPDIKSSVPIPQTLPAKKTQSVEVQNRLQRIRKLTESP